MGFFSACLFRNIASYRLLLWFCGPWMLLFEKYILQALWLFFRVTGGTIKLCLRERWAEGIRQAQGSPGCNLLIAYREWATRVLPAVAWRVTDTPGACSPGSLAPHHALQRMSPTGGARLARSSQLSSWPWSVPWKELHQEANVKVCEPEACQTDARATHPKNSPAKFACTWNTRLCPPTPWDIGASCAIRRDKGHFIKK